MMVRHSGGNDLETLIYILVLSLYNQIQVSTFPLHLCIKQMLLPKATYISQLSITLGSLTTNLQLPLCVFARYHQVYPVNTFLN